MEMIKNGTKERENKERYHIIITIRWPLSLCPVAAVSISQTNKMRGWVWKLGYNECVI